MKLEEVTMEIRPRTDWEAVDSGLAMTRRDFWRCWALWWLAVLPVFLLIYPLREWPMWWVAILLWAKWAGCRMVLYQLSRRLFGENPSWKSLWREIPRAWVRRFFYRMIWARFSPWKPISAAVEDLEGLRGDKFSRRMGMINRKGEGVTILLTLLSGLGVFWLGFGIFMIGLLLFPESVQTRWSESFDPERMFDSNGYLWLMIACVTAACSLLDVFLTGAGFGLYINSRTWIEGWDVELAFKRMANRLLGQVSLWCGMFLLLFSPWSHAEEEEIDPTPREAIEEVKRHEDFIVYKEKYREPKAVKPRSTPSISAAPGIAQFLGGIGYLFLGVFLLALLAGIVWLISRARFLQSGANPSLKPIEKARVVMGMEVTAASLPKNLLDHARQLWSAGECLQAMSLLYRGSLAWWIESARVSIQESDTEGDCLRRVAELRHPHGSYFHDLTQAWLLGAYAKQLPPQESWELLCQHWPFQERRQA